MRILILNEEFFPDTHGYLITDIAKIFTDNSNEVHFFSAKSKNIFNTSNPKYKRKIEELSQIKLKRFWVIRFLNNYKIVKIMNSILYSLQCLVNGIFLNKAF